MNWSTKAVLFGEICGQVLVMLYSRVLLTALHFARGDVGGVDCVCYTDNVFHHDASCTNMFTGHELPSWLDLETHRHIHP